MEKQKLGLIGRCLFGGAIALGMSGCEESYNENDFMATGMRGYEYMAETPEQKQFFGLAAHHFEIQANREDRRRVAESQRGEKDTYENLSGDVVVLNCGTIYSNCNILGWEYTRLNVKLSDGTIGAFRKGNINQIIDKGDKGSNKRFK